MKIIELTEIDSDDILIKRKIFIPVEKIALIADNEIKIINQYNYKVEETAEEIINKIKNLY